MSKTHTSRTNRLTKTLSLVLVAGVSSALFSTVALADHNPNQQAPKNVKNRHFLKMYKVEKVFDIEEDEYVHDADKTHVFCNKNGPGAADDDYAIDGMWKVVDVDQDDLGGRPYQDIKVYASYSDALDRSKWHFEVENRSDGRAQMKFYLTCLGYETEPNSHRHSWHVTDPFTTTLSSTSDTPDAVTNDNERFVVDTDVGTCSEIPNPGGQIPSTPENYRYIAVSPGFQFTQGFGDLYRSNYRESPPGSSTFDSRVWGFWVEPGPFTVTVSHRCLRIKTDGSGHGFPHNHDLLDAFHPSLSDFFGVNNTPIGGGPDHVETRVRRCDSHEKGMVHAFDLDPDMEGQYLWFLGMDPRIKARAYKILNEGALFRNTKLGLMCFNDRTGKRKRI